MWIRETDARWIWPAALGDGPNQYAEFRHEFDLESSRPGAELIISADSNYAVWLNGAFLDCGQYPDVPPRRTCDRLPAGRLLKSGRNVLVIGVHYQGVTSFQYLKESPGLIYALRAGKVCAVSGAATRWRRAAGYRAGPMPRITRQLGFTFEYDARITGPWKRISRKDIHGRAWEIALRPRPLPKLTVGKRIPAAIVAQGLLGPEEKAPGETAAQAMQGACMSARPLREIFMPEAFPALPSANGLTLREREKRGDGIYVIVDLGREEAGFVEFEIEAGAGTRIDLAHGEHLDDLRVRAHVDGRNFANRYVCREGRQVFTHFYHRAAGRYLQINVRGVRGRFTLIYAGLRPAEYPAIERGAFESADSQQGEIFRTSVRTLRLCMHEHYEDCPWREQALYANDGRNQALSGYYAFGDYRFPAASLGLLAQGLKPDGWLEMCMPSEIEHTIPSFTFVWILAIADHWRFAGNRSFVRRMLPAVRLVLEAQEARLSDGLLPCPAGERYWQFYDWAPGLGGGRRIQEGETRFDAPLNMFMGMAFRAGAVLAEACGAAADARRWSDRAENLPAAIHTAFWDASEGAYLTYKGARTERHFAELTQALAVLGGAARSGHVRDALLALLAQESNDLVKTTLSQSLYKYEALLSGPPQFGLAALRSMDAEWGRMLRRGATSFWETRLGASDFRNAGSLCHGWSGIPAYFYSAYVLGVRPVEPGFRTFCIDPAPGVVPSARGKIPTPHGTIRVEWERRGESLRALVEHPAACRCATPSSGRLEIRRVARRRSR